MGQMLLCEVDLRQIVLEELEVSVGSLVDLVLASSEEHACVRDL